MRARTTRHSYSHERCTSLAGEAGNASSEGSRAQRSPKRRQIERRTLRIDRPSAVRRWTWTCVWGACRSGWPLLGDGRGVCRGRRVGDRLGVGCHGCGVGDGCEVCGRRGVGRGVRVGRHGRGVGRGVGRHGHGVGDGRLGDGRGVGRVGRGVGDGREVGRVCRGRGFGGRLGGGRCGRRVGHRGHGVQLCVLFLQLVAPPLLRLGAARGCRGQRGLELCRHRRRLELGRRSRRRHGLGALELLDHALRRQRLRVHVGRLVVDAQLLLEFGGELQVRHE
mmetsp:Transcript_4693/g.12032  ORF Transcript_4693/g.12032 Transcript_4693/m.12032 type:complete len:279 (+) Transcript_4693:51-887(+)